MRRNIYEWFLAASILAGFTSYLFLAVPFSDQHDVPPKTPEHIKQTGIISPIDAAVITNLPLVQLGYDLFNDPNLASDNKTSCESCHNLNTNGAEISRVSTGVNGSGTRNSPTIFNVSLNSRFFWDGRSVSLSHQIDSPIHHPLEMNSNWADIISYVENTPTYQRSFKKIFNAKVTKNTIKLALITFMESLLTPDAPFDLYLQGNDQAISDTAKIGWHKFKKLRCIVCHQGKNIGGNLFQRFGNMTNEKELNSETDLGRFAITGNPRDKYVFRVASLRNVAKTAPYFHDGRARTLEDAIKTMAVKQLGQELDAASIIELSAFLRSLSAPNPVILEVLSQ